MKAKKGRTTDDGGDKFMADVYIHNRKYLRTIGSGEISEGRRRCHILRGRKKLNPIPFRNNNTNDRRRRIILINIRNTRFKTSADIQANIRAITIGLVFRYNNIQDDRQLM
ncbi:hypothetical protein QTP88_006025 [Uroleucon formosanum]